MKNRDRDEEIVQGETDHDAAWRERIQRALRDLRSASTAVEERTETRTRSH